MNKIPRTTQIIKATPKTKELLSLICYKNKTSGNWRGIDKDNNSYYVFSSLLRNSDFYTIECFNSIEEFKAAQEGKKGE